MEMRRPTTLIFPLVVVAMLAFSTTAFTADVMTIVSDKVGIGTETPGELLHVKGGKFKVEQPSGAAELLFATPANTWTIKQNGVTGRFTLASTLGGTTPFKFDTDAQENLLRVGVLTTVTAGDTVDVNGHLVVTGDILLSGTCTNCDAVLQPDWPLESIEDHASAMFENSFLPAVGPTPEGPVTINVFEKTTGMLQELEKAHIYIAQLNEKLTRIEAELAALKEQQ